MLRPGHHLFNAYLILLIDTLMLWMNRPGPGIRPLSRGSRERAGRSGPTQTSSEMSKSCLNLFRLAPSSGTARERSRLSCDDYRPMRTGFILALCFMSAPLQAQDFRQTVVVTAAA